MKRRHRWNQHRRKEQRGHVRERGRPSCHQQTIA
jgi:hypothetical protein